jgi:hypothetical protein
VRRIPIRELRDGEVSGWEIPSHGKRKLSGELVEFTNVTRLRPLATVVQGHALEAPMLHRKFYLRNRLVGQAITAVVNPGAALLFSYLILQVHS